MSLSRFEMFSLCRKAARGAGYDWGLAEEIGTACIDLCEQGIDPTDHLVAFLKTGVCRSSEIPTWPPAQKRVCPFFVGCGIFDRGGISENLIISNLYAPILLCALLKRQVGTTWRVSWKNCVVTISNSVIKLEGDPDVKGGCQVSIELLETAVDLEKSARKFPVREPAGLLEFAAKTYVPESEASRARGAG